MSKNELPLSGKKLLEVLDENGPLTQKELIKASDIPARTARYALRRLIELELIAKRCNLTDARSFFYFKLDEN